MLVLQTGAFDENGNPVKTPSYPPDTMTANELYEKIYGKPHSGMAWEAYRTF